VLASHTVVGQSSSSEPSPQSCKNNCCQGGNDTVPGKTGRNRIAYQTLRRFVTSCNP
jgi:hypothetical protein